MAERQRGWSRSVCLRVQLDNADEQAAQVRRELDSRLSAAEEMTRVNQQRISIKRCCLVAK